MDSPQTAAVDDGLVGQDAPEDVASEMRRHCISRLVLLQSEICTVTIYSRDEMMH